jgi:uncharacterized membrane protein
MVQGSLGKLGILLLILGILLTLIGALLLLAFAAISSKNNSVENSEFAGIVILGPIVIPLGSLARYRKLSLIASLVLLIILIIILYIIVKE